MTARPALDGTAQDPGGAQEEEYRPDPRRWRALSVTLVAGFMSLLDVSIVSVALPTLQRDLGGVGSGGPVGGLGLRADLRADARPRRPAG